MMKRPFAVFCFGMMSFVAPSMAGFEFVPATAPSTAQEQAPVQNDAQYAAMPILPTEAVSAEPLAAPQSDAILANPVSRAEETYVRRQQSVIPMKPQGNEPIDTAGFREAVMEGTPVSVAPAQPAAATMSERLIINLYPLREANASSGDMGQVSIEQAMMEDSGMLRAAAVPNSSRTTGMISRAKQSKDLGSRVAYRDDAQNAPPVVEAAPMGMTPIPGGEGNMPTAEERVPRAPQNTVPPVRTTNAANGYSEAVGFGRDLPLPLAMSQIVPAGYSYEFASGVDAGQTVSWEGGKPWNVVLNDMLAPSGMKAVIESNQVKIVRS